MAGLSAVAQNALRGAGYGSNVDPSAAGIYGLGYASAGYDVKKLNEQLAMANRELDEKIRQWNAGTALDLIGSGFGNRAQQEGLVRDITGYDLQAPKSEEQQMRDMISEIAANEPGRPVYRGYGSFSPMPQKRREAQLMKYMMGIKPMQGHIKLGGAQSYASRFPSAVLQNRSGSPYGLRR